MYYIADKMFGIEENFYVASHFIFGLCGPLFFGYVNPGIKNESGKHHWRFSWHPVCAVSWVLLWSFANEVVDDPVLNGIPFLQAWHHFAANMAGLAFFTVVAAFFLRRRRDIDES